MPKGDGLAGLRQVLVALAGGLISAGFVLSVETDSLLRLLLVGLAPLPLLAVGFRAGPLTCFAAGLVAAVSVTVVIGSIEGASYFGAAAIPAACLAWQATRPAKDGRSGNGSGLLLVLTGLAMAELLGLIAYFAQSHDGLERAIAERFDLAPAAAAMAARIAPGLAVALWMGVIAAGGVIAGWLVRFFGVADRPSIDVGSISLPIWIGPILMVAGLAGAVLREGMLGIICLNSAIVLMVPFAFLGLALIQALLGKWPGGPAWIAAVYVVLLGSPAVLGWKALLVFTLMLAALGSADQLMDFRDLRGLRAGMRRK